MEKERSILRNVGIGQDLWEEEVKETCYLVNQSPTSSLIDKTAQEVWIGKKPSFKHLIFFVVMHMYMFQRRKGASWITKLKKCIFIGYKDGIKSCN